nr:hypothetical protein [Corallococcus llansteffanensis]
MLRGLASFDVLTIRLREVTFDGVVLLLEPTPLASRTATCWPFQ